MQDSPVPSGSWGEFYFIVERQHGSSEEEGAAQRKQGGPQRIGSQGRSHTRAEQGSPQGRAQAQVARFESDETEKPARAGFFAVKNCSLQGHVTLSI
jgi:hypothetical protein